MFKTPLTEASLKMLSVEINPAQARSDAWNSLRETADRLETKHKRGMDDAELESYVSTQLETLMPYERYWVFPGMDGIARLKQYLDKRDFELLAEEIRTTTRLLSEHGDRACLLADLDRPGGIDEQTLRGSKLHYFTVLVVYEMSEEEEEELKRTLRRLQKDTEDFAYELLVLSNMEDALVATLSNYDIQACFICHDFPLKSEEGPDVFGDFMDEYEQEEIEGSDMVARGLVLAEWLKYLRPHLNLYLITDESLADMQEPTHLLFDRVFYGWDNSPDFHMTILAGVRERYKTPFFDALKNYALEPVGNFHALPIARGNSILNSRWIQDMAEFYGLNIFLAETSSTTGGLDSLLAPTGTILEAQEKAAETWGSQHTYFATNGTSTSNKIVVQALTQPGDIVLIDRNCHKSHHYGLVLGGAHPLYLDAYPLEPYAFFGAVPLRTIKKHLLELKMMDRLDKVKMLLLTNCTFDGITYNPQQVMEEILAIKPDICFLWDEAWYSFATFNPISRCRTAMYSARALQERYAGDAYREEYLAYRKKMDELDPDDDATWLDNRLMPDPDKVRIRVYATQSTHKSMSALRQGSMIHVYDQDFARKSEDAFNEAVLTHTTTSPNYQIIASLDLARRQADLEGFGMTSVVYQMAVVMRERIENDPLLRKYFRVLEPEELIPADYRQSGLASYIDPAIQSTEEVYRAWEGDEFVLDPTRITLYLANTGYNGNEFKEDILMDRYGIQVNKTSINSVLFIFTIGVTWSSVSYLLDVLKQIATDIEGQKNGMSKAEQTIFENRVKALSADLPPLPSFSYFHPYFRPHPGSPEGDMRDAYFLAYEEENREYIKLEEAIEVVRNGRELVSTNFVVPYPPGFPIFVPGQVIDEEILDFMQKLDVKEIHGYRAELGLSVFTDEALERYAQEAGREHHISDG
jgi:arginine decarboxylase